MILILLFIGFSYGINFDYDNYEFNLLNDDTDLYFDEEIEEEEYDLGFFFKPIYSAVADDDGDIKQEGLKRVEETVLKIEKELVQLENVDRVALIECDENIPKSAGARGNGDEADIAKQKANEGKQISEQAELLIPQLRKKQEEIIKTLPRREAIRLARRFDLRHRFDFAIDQEEFL
ncbi:hypothetical protein EDI_005250 [Entamoeba dispar SAW760]|uniref:Uncharacterized protein n=1 Tax=Entamoeba dispar (strain ATCC PRA-260 / SAW760) TaxID=370354 RepID=B0EA14_ENTDS|nr:uncharacterized protein EDI_005250 [Entamoeba dispar SAW760]EDR28627.1 hypothetical protein EDI_005250 [Entamoeba dispar SAW760]|eukprot:EDR28627.1 hypothetical protein EDI_005250 [Entamoeba dispar SAW760]